jgi:phage host-nuclease inhibitor protein Gam
MAKTKIKTPALEYPPPANRDEADNYIFRLGEAMRSRAETEIAMNEAVAHIKLESENAAEPYNREIAALTAGLQTFCEANRKELCPGNSKTVKFGNGEVSWRARPASVTLRGVEAIIAFCRSHRKHLFIRLKREVNKEAMLAHPKAAAAIPGVTIASAGEDFIVTPINAELEEVQSNAR